MTDNVRELVNNFINFADIHEDFEIGDLVKLNPNAPKIAQDAYKKYIKIVSHSLIGWDDLIIKNRKIIAIRNGSKGKSRSQCEIVMQLIDSGWIDNDPFIK